MTLPLPQPQEGLPESIVEAIERYGDACDATTAPDDRDIREYSVRIVARQQARKDLKAAIREWGETLQRERKEAGDAMQLELIHRRNLLWLNGDEEEAERLAIIYRKWSPVPIRALATPKGAET